MTALLFERDQVDRVDDWSSSLSRLGRSSILWIDLECPGQNEIRHLAGELELAEESANRLGDGDHRPYFGDFGSYLHVTAYAPREDGGHQELERVECLVSKHWLVTVRRNPVEVIETFGERAAGSGATGRLDGPDFLANLLDWVLEGYLDAFERIELALEELDSHTMQGTVAETDGALRRLVELRQAIGRLRRALVSHRTNEIVKVLTLASVLLLPGALIAGVMGMNFKIGVFETGAYFWVVIAGIVGIALATLAVARAREWI